MGPETGAHIGAKHGETISVVVPARNEEATIAAVVERSFAAFDALGRAGEVLVVNDGSTDRTAAILQELGTRYPTLRVFTHRRSRGMTAGLQTMFSASVGDIVILIPADMESDPLVDVPALVNYLDAEDVDVAAGWRQERKDSKVLASRVYNAVMTAIGGVQVHDGNWIKAMRREVVDSFPPLRSDWHRFLLMIAAHNGYRIGETPTYYRPRQAGSSKFGWERIPKSFLDVLVLKFLLTFSEAPMRFFGGLGLLGLSQLLDLPLPGRPLPLHQHPAAPHLHRRWRPGHHQRPPLPGRLPRRTHRQPRRAHRPPRTQTGAGRIRRPGAFGEQVSSLPFVRTPSLTFYLKLVQKNRAGAIDSLPLPVIQFHLVPGGKDDWPIYGVSYGKVPSKKQTIYGFKLHLLITLEGLILDFELAPANAGDLAVGLELLSQRTALTVLSDKA